MANPINLASDSLSIIQDMVEETDCDNPPSIDSLVKLADLLENLYEEVVELHNDLEDFRSTTEYLEQEVEELFASLTSAHSISAQNPSLCQACNVKWPCAVAIEQDLMPSGVTRNTSRWLV